MTNITTLNRMDLEDPYEGQKFASFEVLKKYLEEYGKKNYVKFWTRSSHTISSLKSKTRKVNPDLKYACMKFACIFGGEKSRCRGSGIRKSTTYRNLGCPFTINAIVGEDGNHVKLETVILDHNHTMGKSLYDSLKKSKNKMKILETKVNYCASSTRNRSSERSSFKIGTVPCEMDAHSLVQILQSNGKKGTMRADHVMAAKLAANEEFQKCVREIQAKYGPNIKIIVVNRDDKKKKVRKAPVEINEHQLARIRQEIERNERIRMMRMAKTCRLCLSSDNKLNPIFKSSLPLESTLLSFKIMSCASIEINKNDDLPGNICTDCEQTLQIAYNFRVQCENSDTVVRLPTFGTEHLEDGENPRTPSADAEEQGPREENERIDEPEETQVPHDTKEPEEFQEQDVEYTVAPCKTATEPGMMMENIGTQSANEETQVSHDTKEPEEFHQQDAEYTVAPCETATEPGMMMENIGAESANIENADAEMYTQIEDICPICGNGFGTYADMLQHLEEHNEIGNFLLSCNFCSAIFSTVKSLVDHLNYHMEVQYLPEDGNTNVANDNEIENVNINVNEIEIEIENENENENANFNYNNNVSVAIPENAPPIVEAPQVEEPPVPEPPRDRHNDSGYLCNICGKILKSKDRFQSHKNTHEGLRPHICMKCGRGFADRKNMHQHYDIVHLRKAKHECPICQKKFYAPTKMKSHLTMHYGLKPYSCDICNKTFRLRMNMMKHKKTHSNERPHKCDKCKAAFIDKNLLTRHSYVHGGVRPHVCPDCGHRFTLKFNLKKHMVSGRCTAKRNREPDFGWEGIPQFQPGEAPLRVRIDEEQGNIVEEILQEIGAKP